MLTSKTQNEGIWYVWIFASENSFKKIK